MFEENRANQLQHEFGQQIEALLQHWSNAPDVPTAYQNSAGQEPHVSQDERQANEAPGERPLDLYQLLVEHSLHGIALVQDFHIVYANPTLTQITGYSVDELRAWVSAIIEAGGHINGRSQAWQRLTNHLASGIRPARLETCFPHKDGTRRWAETNASIVSYQGKPAILLTCTDTTERKQAHDELERRVQKRTEELARLNAALQNEIAGREIQLLQVISREIGDAEDFQHALQVTLTRVCKATHWNMAEAWTISTDEACLQCSPAWYCDSDQLLPYRQMSQAMTFSPGQGLPGRIWTMKQPTWIQDVSRAPDALFTRSQKAQEAGLKAVLGIPIIADNRLLAVLVFYKLASRREDKHLLDLVTAVATQLGSLLLRKQVEEEKARLFEQVKQQREQLRALASRRRRLAHQVIVAQEEERRRVSRELHDEAGQVLTAMKVGLEMMQSDLLNLGDDDARYELMRQRLQQVISLSEETSARIRTLAHRLRPAALDDLGLDLALEGLCHDFAEWTNLTTIYEGADVHLSSAAEICLYRFLQEGLTNVTRHAQASQVRVTLGVTAGAVRLTLSDDGRGFDVAAHSANGSTQGIGLLGMEERLESLGGRLEIESDIDRGTRLTAVIPVQE